jgi:hypothetical protein
MAGREQTDRQMNGGVSIARRWAEYLVAVLTGNVVYLFIEPGLPTVLRHRLFRVDLGLVIDFLICVGVYGLVRLARPWDSARA